MKRVLIVEDQRMPREHMERTLSDSGNYALAASVNGADIAFAICQQQPVDLILMDVCTMGNKDGIEAEPRKMRVVDPESGETMIMNEMTFKQWQRWKQRLANE